MGESTEVHGLTQIPTHTRGWVRGWNPMLPLDIVSLPLARETAVFDASRPAPTPRFMAPFISGMTRALSRTICLVALLCTACGDAAVAPLEGAHETAAQSLGEQVVEGYPSHQERVVVYLTNRARTEPDAFNADEPYPPSPPLQWDLPLSKAARFHAEHIEEENCWCSDHSSCCPLEGQGDATQCASAATECGVATAADRVQRFSPNYSGENMARGQRSGIEAVDGWIRSSGHWANINGAHAQLGVGRVGNAWVQDFGSGATEDAVIGDGIHFKDGGGTSTTFGITYHQPGTGGPQAALLLLDGQCIDLDLRYGTPELGAFETNMSLEAGCHRYVFYVRDGHGDDHVYPTYGSLGVASGDAGDCPLYSDNRPADTCSPAGQACQTGDTRPCYTGPYDTRGVGICADGAERCIGGAWTGECRLQTKPLAEDVCEDSMDNDCDGAVDEGCSSEDDAPMTRGTGEMEVDSDPETTPPSTTHDHQGEGGCQTCPTQKTPSLPWSILWGCMGLLIAVRRARQ